MDDFGLGAFFWAVLILIAFGLFITGQAVTEDSVVKQCKDFSKFSIGSKVYECSLIKNTK